MSVALKPKAAFCTANGGTLTSGVTQQDPSAKFLSSFQHYSYDNILYKLSFATTTLVVNQPSDAALAFGEWVFTYPVGLVTPLVTHVQMTSLCPTGLSATAGEIGLGTTIGSGANATLGAVGAAAENVMEGTTISNHVAATTLVTKKFNVPTVGFDHGATAAAHTIDATAGTSKVYVNVASTWNQTAAENVAWQVNVQHFYMFLGTNFGAE
jgi:hypothetical protein